MTTTTPDRPRNILIILADQLRRQALGCYGDPNVQTPHIDRLASEGVRFENACSTFPVCVPFRFSLMTGQYAHSRGMPSIGYRMSPAERTLADEWNEAGYHSVYVGKWHLYAGGHGVLPGYDNIITNRTPVPRDHQGRWQKWMGFELCNAHFDTCYFEDDDPTPKPLGKYQTDGLFDLTMDYLAKRKPTDDPFACVLSVEPPHPPFEAPPELEQQWRARTIREAPNFMVPDASLERYRGRSDVWDPERKEQALANERLYYAMVENLDQNVGRMLAFLDDAKLRDDTIVVLLSDHGHCGYRHCWQQKTITYEESIGIPLIVSHPDGNQALGQSPDHLVGTEDLFPTLLGLTGVQTEGGPGRDFSGLALGQSAEDEHESILIQNTFIVRPDMPRFDKGWRGIRTKRYKYTVEGGVDGGGQPWQFFDLENDPYELHNLVDHPEARDEVQWHHIMLRDKLIEVGDDYPLAPAFGIEALHVSK